ncbi:hypothetical protein BJ138DRAFT_1162176 [Hygrophoropsis aurantiaca]|uniref:Uncharacterized protein n=1 Tax=Hygrophoropsis aurantiaca TaxID=72124 RepID=A0ACB8A0S1_9AGAM|nr:hypothetical protein BJ138DRAFT_1162176 [Hygrophoropsis aurantiaca]
MITSAGTAGGAWACLAWTMLVTLIGLVDFAKFLLPNDRNTRFSCPASVLGGDFGSEAFVEHRSWVNNVYVSGFSCKVRRAPPNRRSKSRIDELGKIQISIETIIMQKGKCLCTVHIQER